MAKYEQGKSGNPKGRPLGSENKVTKTFKGLIQGELDRLGPEYLHKWAAENPGHFYTIAAKLIPTELHAAIIPPVRTYEEIKAELVNKHGEPLAQLLLEEITAEQFVSTIAAQVDITKVMPERVETAVLLTDKTQEKNVSASHAHPETETEPMTAEPPKKCITH